MLTILIDSCFIGLFEVVYCFQPFDIFVEDCEFEIILLTVRYFAYHLSFSFHQAFFSLSIDVVLVGNRISKL